MIKKKSHALRVSCPLFPSSADAHAHHKVLLARAPAENFPGGLNRIFHQIWGSNLKKNGRFGPFVWSKKENFTGQGGGPGPTLPISAGAPE